MRLDQNRDGVFDGDPRSLKSKEMPVTLTYSVDLKQNQISRPVEQIHFKNPYQGPMWVDELHFFIRQSDFTTTFDVVPPELIAMRMKVNNRYIIDEYVPLYLLGPHTDSVEVLAIVDDQGQPAYSFFWRLAKPLWVDELDDLLVELTWLPGYSLYVTPSEVDSLTMSVDVTLSGRASTNENRPSERYLPFNVVWNPGVLTTSIGTEFTQRSPDSALRNGRDTPVVVSRIMGIMPYPIGPFSAGGNGISTNFLMDLRISHSAGYYLVKDLTPFFEMFQNLGRAFDVKFVLQPKEFLTVELQTRTITLVNYPDVEIDAAYYLAGFALQGYSVEKLR